MKFLTKRSWSVFASLVLAGLLTLFGTAAGWAQTAGMDKKSDGRFTGLAFVTDDLNWYEKFQRPETPSIDGPDYFGVGQRGALAILFSNAEPREGRVKITCDVTAFDPKGSKQIVKSAPCYEGPYAGPNVLYPALLDLKFKIGANDPKGQAGFKLTLHDAYSRRAVDLTVSFMQGSRR